MAVGTALSRLLGLVKAIMLVYAIGQTASLSADAFANGNALPNMIYYLVLGGMLQAVLVPQIVAESKAADGGQGYINKILTLMSVGLALITTLAVLASPWLVRVFAVSWSDEQLALATAFAYLCLPQIFFYGLYAVLGEILNARSVFGPFTWAPVLNNVVAILGLAIFIALFGSDPAGERALSAWNPAGILVLAGSATAGIAAQALVLFLWWKKAGLRFRPDFRWRGMGLAKTARLAGWAFGTVIALQISSLVTTNIVNTASGEGPAQLAVQNAWLVFTMPHSVFAVSIGTAYFTRLSDAGQSGDLLRFRKEFSDSTQLILLVMSAATALMIALAPYASEVMQYGASEEQIALFAHLIQAYALGLVGYSMMFVVNRVFFAVSDTKTPFILQAIFVVTEVVFMIPCLLLPKEFTAIGVALVTSAATILNVLIAFRYLQRKFGNLNLASLYTNSIRLTTAIIASSLAGYWVTGILRSAFASSPLIIDILCAIGMVAVVLAMFALALLLVKYVTSPFLRFWNLWKTRLQQNKR